MFEVIVGVGGFLSLSVVIDRLTPSITADTLCMTGFSGLSTLIFSFGENRVTGNVPSLAPGCDWLFNDSSPTPCVIYSTTLFILLLLFALAIFCFRLLEKLSSGRLTGRAIRSSKELALGFVLLKSNVESLA
ncbi:hypothetical protein AX774_g8113 [Zancudomyces culisetae]|uniref:Uncharacterized protein n=1 Tax=Zancudomyces culisetae TaxID=1213189 RepID=A0A1R1PC06_ZANCU|nr:hypothetical protein AX774_g8113 [Zancudomyces culisetae]|eukprot:OMH78496.1 hypothetical protein AX774_g8113 [Zancudomyces culisetae]